MGGFHSAMRDNVGKRRQHKRQLSVSKKYNAGRGTVSGGYQVFDAAFYERRFNDGMLAAMCEKIEKQYEAKHGRDE